MCLSQNEADIYHCDDDVENRRWYVECEVSDKKLKKEEDCEKNSLRGEKTKERTVQKSFENLFEIEMSSLA